MSIIPYTIKSNSKSKSVRIMIHQDGSVVVTKPKRVSNIVVRFLILRKENWIKEKIIEMESKPKRLLAHYSSKDYKENKQEAYEIVWNKVLHFNKFYQYDVGKIYIRNQKTRWGSCSGKKNLNFNYKIVFLPEHLQDYIIVHELCHLKEMNHSSKFWNNVALKIPNYKEIIKEIKLY